MLNPHTPTHNLPDPLADPLGAVGAKRRRRAEPTLAFEASCRPMSWSLYGVHARGIVPQSTCPESLTSRLAHRTAQAPTWNHSRVAELLHAAHELAEVLGNARLWLWCPEGLPTPKALQLIAGQAALCSVGLQSLGLEVPVRTIWSMDTDDRAQVAALRAAGLDVAVRLEGVPSDLASSVVQAREMQMAVVAGEVQDSQAVVDWGHLCISAVAGPVVCPRQDLETLRRFLGPSDPGLSRMRADSF